METRGADGNPRHGIAGNRTAAVGNDDEADVHKQCGSQNGAKVVGIGNVIESHDRIRCSPSIALQPLLEVDDRLVCGGLVGNAQRRAPGLFAGITTQPIGGHPLDPEARTTRSLDQIVEPVVRGGEMQNSLGTAPDRRENRMAPGDPRHGTTTRRTLSPSLWCRHNRDRAHIPVHVHRRACGSTDRYDRRSSYPTARRKAPRRDICKSRPSDRQS